MSLRRFKAVFEVTDLREPQKIVGIEIERDHIHGRLKISQTQYIDNLLAKYNIPRPTERRNRFL